MVELRKRKAPAEPTTAPPAKKKSNPVKAAVAKAKSAVSKKPKPAPTTNGTSSSSKVAAGATITLEGFGGEVETNDGVKTTLKALVDESKAGVVIFTYPKANTPGCTNQACLFRDSYTPLTRTGLSIYGLSTDSPKSNTTFKTKQSLPYSLLCDPSATLIAAIGMKKPPKSTARGVFVVNKEGKVLLAEAGGPAATVEAVKTLVDGSAEAGEPEMETSKAEDGAPTPVTEPAALEESKKGEELAPSAASVIEPAVPVNEPAAPMTEPSIPPAPITITEQKDDAAKADVAADVADTAATLQRQDTENAEVAADVADTAATLDQTPKVGTPMA